MSNNWDFALLSNYDIISKKKYYKYMSDKRPSWEKHVPKDTNEGEAARKKLLYMANYSNNMKAFPRSIMTDNGQIVKGQVEELTENAMFKIDSSLIVSYIKIMGDQLTEYFKLVLKLANSQEIEKAVLDGVLSLETLLRPREFDFPEEVLDSLILGPRLNGLVNNNRTSSNHPNTTLGFLNSSIK